MVLLDFKDQKEMLETKDQLGIRVPKEVWVQEEFKAQMETEVQRDLEVPREIPEGRRDMMDLVVIPDQVESDLLALKEYKENKENPVLMLDIEDLQVL
jgi:hypothetical protein